MKRLILFAAACGMMTEAYSQDITGRITDERNVPLAYANVVLLSLPDSAFVSGTISGEDGEFSVSGHTEKGASRCLKISSVGYRTLILDVREDEAGTIVLKEESTLLPPVLCPQLRQRIGSRDPPAAPAGRLDRRRQPTGFQGLVPVIPAIQVNKCGNVALITKLFPDIFCSLRDKFYICNQ